MSKPEPASNHEQDALLREIMQGTAGETGEGFFAALVKHLARALGTSGAWVTEFLDDDQRLRALAFWLNGDYVDGYEYSISGTPCEPVVKQSCLIHVPDNVVKLYPDDPDLAPLGAVSYMGVPLPDLDGTMLGHLAVLDSRPMLDATRNQDIMRIFAARAAAELQRLRAERHVHERERKLSGLIDGVMDAVIELDDQLRITLLNPAAERMLACKAARALGRNIRDVLAPRERERIPALIASLREAAPEASDASGLWIVGGLQALDANDNTLATEATLSQHRVGGRTFYTLILRNLEDRLRAERTIRALSEETAYLREELDALQGFGEIIGRSRPLLRVLEEVREVAATDATVLIHGETGVGKELIARAVHLGGPRRDKPLVKVNCGAVPANLIESEFFGHEQGAFTGATKRREGRFALADGGTIFLDEIGELPLDLQSKLLRVLQEGEFEPVGSSRTQRVDVRVVAATNRDLREQVGAGRFRDDLYYRLNVFPITLPPLRERLEDIEPLARAFVETFARRMGRPAPVLDAACIQRLGAYSWPGNVRELQNVLERAVILSREGRLNLDRALPHVAESRAPSHTPTQAGQEDRVYTVEEMQSLERGNLLRALEQCDWRVSGKDGAAARLGINPSTLASRMKALDIKRPRGS